MGRANEEQSAQDVRIVLASAEFSKEITTAVLWLNDHRLDIRCIRIRPYDDNGKLLLDIQQLIPLPEAEQYQVKIREKARIERVAQSKSRDLARFDVIIGARTLADQPKRRAIFHVVKHLCRAGVDPEKIREAMSRRKWALLGVEGQVNSEQIKPKLADLMSVYGLLLGLQAFHSMTRRFDCLRISGLV